jgi:hypothetical protein
MHFELNLFFLETEMIFTKPKDFNEEHAIQAFQQYDKTKSGHISTSNFYTILKDLKGHLLSPFLKESLINVRVFETANQKNLRKKYFTGICKRIGSSVNIIFVFHGV